MDAVDVTSCIRCVKGLAAMFADFSWYHPIPRNFSVPAWQVRIWQLSGKHYRKTRQFGLLKRIECEREKVTLESTAGQRTNSWLLPFRTEIRRNFSRINTISGPSEGDILYFYMAHCPAEMIPICIWLISRCTDRCHLFGISAFSRDPSPQVRKHVAKAFRHLQAWTLLEEMVTL
jgi:hypothetical protein